jgi:hypothetical protein
MKMCCKSFYDILICFKGACLEFFLIRPNKNVKIQQSLNMAGRWKQTGVGSRETRLGNFLPIGLLF